MLMYGRESKRIGIAGQGYQRQAGKAEAKLIKRRAVLAIQSEQKRLCLCG
jgi:hypothetical protein